MIPLLVAAGIGLKAYAGYKASQAQAAQARENARRARMLASDALARGEQKAGTVDLVSSKRQGAQVAAYGHAGVDTGSGSAAKTIADTAMIGALDSEIVRNNAFREAWGYELQASSLDSQAKREESAARWSLLAAVFGGATQFAGAGGAEGGADSGADFSPGGSHEGYT
jgi:hypothetical protein